MDNPVWTREQHALFNRTRDARLPAAHAASRILQGAFGIGLDKSMVGGIPVRVWALPELPVETVLEVGARVARESAGVAARQAAENARRAAAAAGGVLTGEMRREGAPVRRRLLPAQMPTARMPSVVLQHADGLVGEEMLVPAHIIAQPMLHRPDSTSSQNADPIQTYRPASPPPNEPLHPRDATVMPCYWSNKLSKDLNRWLGQETTISTQVSLQRLTLGGVSSTDGSLKRIVTFTASENVRMKLTQFTIPPSARNPSTAWRPLQWLVVQVEHLTLPQVETKGGKKKTVPMPFGGLPYWIMAFPLAAVTKSQTQSPTNEAPEAEQDSTMSSSTLNVQSANEDRWYNWTVLMQTPGAVPAVHGRGVNPKVLKPFMEASAVGRAVVQFSSEDVALIRG